MSGQTTRRGTVRFVRNGLTSSSYTSGRVQIYLTSWGHICDDADFAFTEADVICHQQGYTGAASNSRASFDRYMCSMLLVCIVSSPGHTSFPSMGLMQRRLVTLLNYHRTHIADDVSTYSFART